MLTSENYRLLMPIFTANLKKKDRRCFMIDEQPNLRIFPWKQIQNTLEKIMITNSSNDLI